MNKQSVSMPRTAKQRSVLHERFCRNLRVIREIKGLTQQQLADRLKIERENISDFERGRNPPGLLLIERLAAALRVNPLTLLK